MPLRRPRRLLPKWNKGALTQTSFVVLRSKARIHKRALPALRLVSSFVTWFRERAAPETPNLRSKNQRQERLRRPSGGVRHVAGGWGKSTPATSPERWGRSWASRPSRCAVAARALTPIPPTVPLKPLCGPVARFRVEGGSRGWCGPQPRRARTRPLDATGATQACRRPCRQGVGGALPRHPCPSARRPPAGSPEGAYKACGAGGTPCLGFQGARSPWA